MVRLSNHREVRERRIPCVARRNGWAPIKSRSCQLERERQQEVAAILALLPLHHWVQVDVGRSLPRDSCDVRRAARADRADGRAGEVDAGGTATGDAVVGFLGWPHEVGNPALVAVSCKEDVISDGVVVEEVERSVVVGGVALVMISQVNLILFTYFEKKRTTQPRLTSQESRNAPAQEVMAEKMHC